MKVSFNRTVVNGPYGGGNQVLSLLTQTLLDSGINVSYSLDKDTDFIFLMDIRDEICTFPLRRALEHKRTHGSKIIHRVNENDAHRPPKGSLDLDNKIIRANPIADITVFVSQYLRDYFSSLKFRPKNSYVIWNGSDRSIFNSDGFEFREDGEPLRIITHHWSNNIYKGFPVYRELQKYCNSNRKIANFTFMGRSYKDFIEKRNIMEPKPYSEIPSTINKYDIYVTASIAEPGGNHIMEGISCGLIPLVGSNTGSCVEYTNGFNQVFENSDDLFGKINAIYEDYELYKSMKSKSMNEFDYSSVKMCNKYLDIFNEYS